MNIIYNPYYTERPYLGKMNLFNQVVVGTRGLLTELELRAGLTAVYPTPTERIVAYIDAIQKENKLFFEPFGFAFDLCLTGLLSHNI